MQYHDLKEKNEKELKALVSEEQAKLHDLRLKSAMNQLKDVRAIREARKDIARLMTKLSSLLTKK